MPRLQVVSAAARAAQVAAEHSSTTDAWLCWVFFAGEQVAAPLRHQCVLLKAYDAAANSRPSSF